MPPTGIWSRRRCKPHLRPFHSLTSPPPLGPSQPGPPCPHLPLRPVVAGRSGKVTPAQSLRGSLAGSRRTAHVSHLDSGDSSAGL